MVSAVFHNSPLKAAAPPARESDRTATNSIAEHADKTWTAAPKDLQMTDFPALQARRPQRDLFFLWHSVLPPLLGVRSFLASSTASSAAATATTAATSTAAAATTR